MTHYFLSDSDKQWLLDLALEVFGRVRGNTSNRPAEPILDYPAPDIYMVLIPDEGIPAAVAGVPGSAKCAIYRKDTATGAFVAIGTDLQIVNNIQSFPIPGKFITICWRDKFGDWYAGGALKDNPLNITWARIISGTNPFTWVEQIDDGAGHWSDKPGGESGTLNLYEANSRPIPAGERLPVWQSNSEWNCWYKGPNSSSDTVVWEVSNISWMQNTFTLVSNTWSITNDLYNISNAVYNFNLINFNLTNNSWVINGDTYSYSNTTVSYGSTCTVTYNCPVNFYGTTTITFGDSVHNQTISYGTTTYLTFLGPSFIFGNDSVTQNIYFKDHTTVTITSDDWYVGDSTHVTNFHFVNGPVSFPTTSNPAVRPKAWFTLPGVTAGIPTWVGDPYEVVCAPPYFCQWDDDLSEWDIYVPMDKDDFPLTDYSLLYIGTDKRLHPLVPSTDGYVVTQVSGKPQWSAPSGGSTVTVAKKTADQSSTSTSYADVTDLTFSVAANTDYVFRFTLALKVSTGGESAYLSVNGPASPTELSYHVEFYGPVSGSTSKGSSSYDDGLLNFAPGSTSRYTAVLEGVFRNGANAGTLALRFHTSSGGANSSTVLQGSGMEYF